MNSSVIAGIQRPCSRALLFAPSTEGGHLNLCEKHPYNTISKLLYPIPMIHPNILNMYVFVTLCPLVHYASNCHETAEMFTIQVEWKIR